MNMNEKHATDMYLKGQSIAESVIGVLRDLTITVYG